MTDVNKNIENKFNTQEVSAELIKKLGEYRQTMHFMAADAPISILRLQKSVEKVLLSNGLNRIYDLFDCDFTKIEGLSVVATGNLTSRLDEFISML